MKAQGFSWCNGGEKLIGKANLTSKILCERHNSELSPLDRAGADYSLKLRQFVELQEVRSRLPQKNQGTIITKIDGRLFERWLIKTTINLCIGSSYPIGDSFASAGEPSPLLVRVAFGLEELIGEMGLYGVGELNTKFRFSEKLLFYPTLNSTGSISFISGGLFDIWGLRFVLSFIGDRLPPDFLSEAGFNDEWKGFRLIRPFKRVGVANNARLLDSQILKFDW